MSLYYTTPGDIVASVTIQTAGSEVDESIIYDAIASVYPGLYPGVSLSFVTTD